MTLCKSSNALSSRAKDEPTHAKDDGTCGSTSRVTYEALEKYEVVKHLSINHNNYFRPH